MKLMPISAALLAAGALFATGALAESTMSKDGYASTKSRIDAEYTAGLQRCGRRLAHGR